HFPTARDRERHATRLIVHALVTLRPADGRYACGLGVSREQLPADVDARTGALPKDLVAALEIAVAGTRPQASIGADIPSGGEGRGVAVFRVLTCRGYRHGATVNPSDVGPARASHGCCGRRSLRRDSGRAGERRASRQEPRGEHDDKGSNHELPTSKTPTPCGKGGS